MSRGHPGPQCQVEGCARSGLVAVFFPDEIPVTVADVRGDDGVEEGLRVCREHGERLGDVRDLGREVDGPGAESLWVVTVDPARAAGWRLMVVIRPSGRHAVCLFPPEGQRV